jgi:predicted GNAT family N-acyltransferase
MHKLTYLVLPPKCELHRASTYRLWFDVYAREMGRNWAYADFRRKIIVDRFEPMSWLYVARYGRKIVGSFRLTFWNNVCLSNYLKLFNIDRTDSSRICVGTRLMVASDFRSQGIAKRLIRNALELVHGIGNIKLFVDCNKPVNKIFHTFGFKTRKSDVLSDEYGRVELLQLNVR